MYLKQSPPKQQLGIERRLKLVVGESQGRYQPNVSPKYLPLVGCPRIPPSTQLRQYQRQVVANWFAYNGRGTLKMATGSGKTITALAIASELYQKIGLKVVRSQIKCRDSQINVVFCNFCFNLLQFAN